MIFYVILCSIPLNSFKLLNVSYSLCYGGLQLFIQHQTPPRPRCPPAGQDGAAQRAVSQGCPTSPIPPLQNPLQNPLPSSGSTTGNAGMVNGWGGILGELGWPSLQESRLRGIPSMAISPCREDGAGLHPAVPSSCTRGTGQHTGAQLWLQQDKNCSSSSLVVHITITADSAPSGLSGCGM